MGERQTDRQRQKTERDRKTDRHANRKREADTQIQREGERGGRERQYRIILCYTRIKI